MASATPLLPNPQYVTDPDAKLHRAESEVLSLREKLEALDHRISTLRRLVHSQHELLAALARDTENYCAECLGTGRYLFSQQSDLLDRYDLATLMNLEGDDWEAIDSAYPDDCEAKNCFGGFLIEPTR